MKRLFLKVLGLTLAGVLASACGGNDSGDDQTPGTLLQVAQRGEFSALVLAAQKAGLTDALNAPNAGLTLFAPTNDAFGLLAGQLGFASISDLLNALSPAAVEAILRYHVLPTRLSAADLVAGGASQDTLLTQNNVVVPLALTTSGGVRITDSIGRVAIVGLTDIPNDNGAFHVIDRVLIPPSVLTVLQTVQSDPTRFAPLTDALSAFPTLVTTLNSDGPFTLFAPTKTAFEAPDVVALLPTLSANQVTTLLQYHVVAADVPSSAIVFGAPVNTVAGQTFTINAGTPPVISDTTATPASIIAVDILASNGVVHVVDKVLIPTLPAAN
jgi:transforming growth factor-beta-induced protein